MEEEISASMLKHKEFYFVRNDCVYTISFLIMNNAGMIIANNYRLEKIKTIYMDKIQFKNGAIAKLYTSKEEAVKNASFFYETEINGDEITINKHYIPYLEDENGVICPEKRLSFEEMMAYFKNTQNKN